MPPPFQAGDWLIDRNNPGRPGLFTGRSQKAGPLLTLELSLPDGTTTWRPLNVLELMEHAQQSLKDRLLAGRFGRARELRRVITYQTRTDGLHHHYERRAA